MTFLPFISPSFSSAPKDTTVGDLTLLASPLPLAQCIRLEIGELFRGVASVLEEASLLRSKELTLIEPFLEECWGLEVFQL